MSHTYSIETTVNLYCSVCRKPLLVEESSAVYDQTIVTLWIKPCQNCTSNLKEKKTGAKTFKAAARIRLQQAKELQQWADRLVQMIATSLEEAERNDR